MQCFNFVPFVIFAMTFSLTNCSTPVNQVCSGNYCSISDSKFTKNSKIGSKIILQIDNDLSSLSNNVKEYVNDMRAQSSLFADDYIFSVKDNNDLVDVSKYMLSSEPGDDKSKGICFKLIYDNFPNGILVNLKISEFETFESYKTFNIYSPENEVRFYNLLSHKKYYLKIESECCETEVYEFVTEDYPRLIYCDKLFNFRDCGGYVTSYGKRVKQGLVYRGCELVKEDYYRNDVLLVKNTTEEAKRIFKNELGIKCEIDLRSTIEVQNADYDSCCFSNDNDIEYYFYPTNSFEAFVSKPLYLKEIFEFLSNANNKPVYLHCFAGADRTGTICFVLGCILGMKYTDILIDYELTSFSGNLRTHRKDGLWDHWNLMIEYFRNIEENGITLWDNTKSLNANMEVYLIHKAGISLNLINKVRDSLLA